MRGFGVRVISFSLLILAWKLGSAVADQEVLPAPEFVLNDIIAGFANGDLLYHVGVTLTRVIFAFVIAMTVGSALGIFMGLNNRADRLLDTWLILLLNLPALVVIVLCYLWFGLNEVAAVVAVSVNKIPNTAVTLREGARAIDPHYTEVSRIFGVSRSRMIRDVVVPQLEPYVAAAARSGLALIWKIVLVVELLGRSNGVGFQIHLFFQLFDVSNILAYTLTFAAVIMSIEYLVLRPLELRVTRWRLKTD